MAAAVTSITCLAGSIARAFSEATSCSWCCPFCLLLPQPLASWAAVLTIGHQLWLIVSGNYSWLNWITAVLGASALSDRFLHFTPTVGSPRPLVFDLLLVALALLTVWLSDKPPATSFPRIRP